MITLSITYAQLLCLVCIAAAIYFVRKDETEWAVLCVAFACILYADATK